MSDDKNKQYRPESYPKPTEADVQLQHQPEYETQPAGSEIEQAPVTKDRPEERNADDKNTNPDRTRNL